MVLRRLRPLIATACVLVTACAARAPGPDAPRFRFAEDTFAFSNDTLWAYDVDEVTGDTTARDRPRPPEFVMRCGAMARAARQFRVHARFDPSRAPVDDATYERLVDGVLARDPRQVTADPDPIVLPGYANLRDFSRERAAVLQRTLGGPLVTFLQRGNWRLIFPFPRDEQARVAASLHAAVVEGRAPIIHVVRFPALTINHLLLVYDVEETPNEWRFLAYDPNIADTPIVLRYDRGTRAFSYPRTIYFGGGVVKVWEVYVDWLA